MDSAGWFPDPGGEPFQRYWDGSQWTTQTRPYPPPARQASPGSQRPVKQPVSSGSDTAGRSRNTKTVALAVVAAFVGLVVIAGLIVLNRMQIDERAREAARQGANIGGTPNSLRDMGDLLCPQGIDTPPQAGVDCSRAALFD